LAELHSPYQAMRKQIKVIDHGTAGRALFTLKAQTNVLAAVLANVTG
jgi:hypothetical protein